MITLGNIYTINYSQYDEVWVICRDTSNDKEYLSQFPNHRIVADLSPLPALFHWYRELAKVGKWSVEAFDEHYVPVFLDDLRHSSQAIELLDELVKLSQTKKIALVCYCENERICHRSIIGGVLMNLGAKIDCQKEYQKYRL